MEKGRNANYPTHISLRSLFRLVEFSDREGMESALRELDDTKLDGRRIRLREEKRSRSRSRNTRGRDGRRSESKRSRSREERGSHDKARRRRSPTPDERSRSMSTDHARMARRERQNIFAK